MHHHFIDKLALLNGFVSGIALFPQVWSVLVSGSSAGISLPTYLLILFNSIVWLFYAMHRRLFSVGISSVFNIVASGILVLAILLR